MTDILSDISITRARQGFSPRETGTFILSLKAAFNQLLEKEYAEDPRLLWRGIADVDQYLSPKNASFNRKGSGIANSRKLVDRFLVQSTPEKGTCVQLLVKIPAKHPPINKSIIQGWQDFFANEVDISPYEEIKRQNLQLLEVMDTLRLKGIETENQLEEISKLNGSLSGFTPRAIPTAGKARGWACPSLKKAFPRRGEAYGWSPKAGARRSA